MTRTEHDKKKIIYKRRNFSVLRVAEWAATILLFLIIILVIAGFLPISHPWLTKQFVRQIKTSGADSCSIKNVTPTLWRGIEFDDLNLSKAISKQEHYSFTSNKVILSVNIISALINSGDLLNGPFTLDNNFFYDIFKNSGGKTKELVHFLTTYEGFKSLTLKNLTFEMLQPDSVFTTVKHGDFEIVQDKEHETLEVEYQVSNFIHGTLNLEMSSGTLSIDDRSLKIVKSRGNYLSGKYRITGEVDLWSSQLYSGQISIDELNISSLITKPDSIIGKVSGLIDGEIQLDPSLLNIDSLQGTGNFTVRNLGITNARVQNSISQLLAVPQIDTLHFEKVKNNIIMKKNLTFFNETQGFGKLLNFKSKGWIQSDGALNQDIKGDIGSQLAKKLPPLVANSMESGAHGERLFRCRVYGHLASPRVELDSLILKRAIGNVFEDVRANLKNLFMKKQSVE